MGDPDREPPDERDEDRAGAAPVLPPGTSRAGGGRVSDGGAHASRAHVADGAVIRPLRRRELGAVAAAAFLSLCLGPGRTAWGQDGDGKGAAGGAAPAPKQPTAVDLALAWLARHQDAGGMWRAGGFSARCSGDACSGPGEEVVADVRATGLVLTVFLGCGETHQSGSYRETVKEAVKYLRNVQNEDGGFGPRTSPRWLPNHMAAADAMAQFVGMTGSDVLRDSAEAGVRFLLAVLDREKGFRSALRDVPPDIETLSEMAGVLYSARDAKLPIDDAAFDALATWCAARTDPRTGAVRPDDPKTKPDALDDDDLATRAALVRVWAPKDAEVLREDALIQRLADRLAAKPPVWTPSPKGRMRFGAWMRRSRFLWQAHGEKHLAWCRSLDKLLVEHQRTDGCAKGSWDPVDVDGSERGRVESTALCALALMWRYQWGWRLAPPKKEKEGAGAGGTPPPAPPLPGGGK